MSDTPPFVSVKLPATLVNRAREVAQTMRRSVASQIEYWATLGKALEHAGLTTGDSQALIARHERAQYELHEPPTLSPRVEVEATRPGGTKAAKSKRPEVADAARISLPARKVSKKG
jgi:hypothetical protein